MLHFRCGGGWEGRNHVFFRLVKAARLCGAAMCGGGRGGGEGVRLNGRPRIAPSSGPLSGRHALAALRVRRWEGGGAAPVAPSARDAGLFCHLICSSLRYLACGISRPRFASSAACRDAPFPFCRGADRGALFLFAPFCRRPWRPGFPRPPPRPCPSSSPTASAWRTTTPWRWAVRGFVGSSGAVSLSVDFSPLAIMGTGFLLSAYCKSGDCGLAAWRGCLNIYLR